MEKRRSATPHSPKESYTPSELAREVGISADALRFYERKGLLPAAPRGSNGRRIFPAGALHRVKVVRAALSLGFTVDELQQILRLRDAGGAPCQMVCRMATNKLVEIDQTLAQLSATRDVLARSLRTWQRKLRNASPGARVGLLDLFAEAHPDRSRQISPRLGPGLRKRLILAN